MSPLPPSDRHEPLPSILALPGRAWRRASRRGRVLAGAVGVIAVAGGLVAWPLVAEEKRVGTRAEAVAYLERWRADYKRIGAAQQPRRVDVGAESSPERLRGATVAALGAGAHCEPLKPTPRTAVRLDCTDAGGLPYRAAGNPSTGELFVCRNFPPPAHPDTAKIIAIPLATACTGEAAQGASLGRDLRKVTPEELVRSWERE